jgi:ParB family chromosome partitioning protein
MPEEAKSNRLGRGLSALLGYEEANLAKPEARGSPRTLPVAALAPSPLQPRKNFAADALQELAASIREKGILQPILVRPLAGTDGRYEIIAGERRWRAAQIAGLHELPVIVRELTDGQVLEAALIENIQRTDLNPIEEARGFKALIDKFGHTQDQLSKVIGKSRSHIANSLRLLALPGALIALIEAGSLGAGHARALIGRADAETLAHQIVQGQLSVRAVEGLVRETSPRAGHHPVVRPEKDADTRGLEKELSDKLGLAVTIQPKGGEKGEIRIAYLSFEQLESVCSRLTRTPVSV